MSATGDHQLVRERIPYCQRLVMKGAMRQVRRYFLTQPMERSFNMLNMVAQIVITYHNDRAGKPLVDHTCHSKGAVNPSNKIMVFFLVCPRSTNFARSSRGLNAFKESEAPRGIQEICGCASGAQVCSLVHCLHQFG